MDVNEQIAPRAVRRDPEMLARCERNLRMAGMPRRQAARKNQSG